MQEVKNILPYLYLWDRSFLQTWMGKTNMDSFPRPILTQGMSQLQRFTVLHRLCCVELGMFT